MAPTGLTEQRAEDKAEAQTPQTGGVEKEKSLQHGLVESTDLQWPIIDLRLPPGDQHDKLMLVHGSTTMPSEVEPAELKKETEPSVSNQDTSGKEPARHDRFGGMNVAQGLVAREGPDYGENTPMERFIAETYGIDSKTQETDTTDGHQASSSCGALALSMEDRDKAH